MRRRGPWSFLFASTLIVGAASFASAGAAQMPDPAVLLGGGALGSELGGGGLRSVGATGAAGALPSRWPRRLHAETAMEAAGVLRVRREAGLDGAGAAICVVDTGVDLGHRDFRDAEGRTRVSWLFDFTAGPRGAHPDLEGRFGAAVFEGPELDAAPSPPGDSHGHGTAVASIAVGDDAGPATAMPGPDAGAAPGADLIVVKLPLRDGIGFEDTLIALGAEACFSVGDASRTVAVLAFGGHDGRHDGTEPLDLELDALAATGARIVVAAGNDGDRVIHASATLSGRAVAPLSLFVPAPEPPASDRFVALSITGEAGTRVTVHGPDGSSVGPVAMGERQEGAGSRSHIIVDGQVAAGSRGAALYVVIGSNDGEAFGGDYRVDVEARGRLDAWIVDADLGATIFGPRFTGAFAAPRGTVTVPGTASGVITVGASIARTAVITSASEVRIGGQVDEVAAFSSVGPLPGAAAKPDLVAPAALVVAALSADVREGDADNLFGGSAGALRRRRVAADRVAVSGTSFAAPLVAGVLALGLGGPDGGANAAGDLDRIRFTARPVGDAPWDAYAGFGVVDAYAFLEGLALTGTRVELTATAPIDSGSPRLFLAGRAVDRGRPFDGTVDLFVDGEQLASLAASAGLLSGPVPAPISAPGQRATLEARLRGESRGRVNVRTRIDEARERVPPSARGGSGCSVVTLGVDRRDAPAWPAVLFLACALWGIAGWSVGLRE